ncbi:MAG: adenylate kinase family protein [Candidatus Thermoplasmatota archaeon]|nr:adenylate kinase family protein [Candidatus Thermoplasmatota archaeon]
MIYALTGVPGSGKSSVAGELEGRGYDVVRFEDLSAGAVSGYDAEADSRIVDVEKVKLRSKPDIVVGHLAHELDVDAIIVLRADPSLIEERLRARGYSEKKVKENAEAEAMDVITIESLERGKAVYEVDTSGMSIREVADRVEEIIKGGVDKRKYAPGKVDFSSYILEGY